MLREAKKKRQPARKLQDRGALDQLVKPASIIIMMEVAGKAVCRCELEPRAESRVGNENQMSEHRDPRYEQPLHGHQFK
jgi:hypothetical protein